MDPAQPARPGRPYLGFALLYAAYCISYVDRAAIALALTQIGREFGLSPTEYGVVLSVFFFGYSLMQLPGGWLADRFGSKYVVIGTAVAWSIFTALTGLAWSFTSLIVIRLIFGLAEGGFPAACIKAVSEQFTGPARPKMSSLMISSNYVGSLLAPLMMAPLLIYFGWRHAFFIVGAAGLIFGLVYDRMIPHRPPAEVPGAARAGRGPSAPARELLRNPLLWQLMLVWFGLGCINKGLDAWMPTYLLQARGLDLKAVGLLTPLPFIMASIATAIGGWVMIRFFDGREKYMIVVSTMLTGIFLYLMYQAPTIAGVITFQSITYFFKSFVFAAAFALPTKLMRDDQIGTSIGMVNLGGQCAGFIAPLVMGLLVDHYGTYDAAFDFLLTAAAVATLVALTIRSRSTAAVPQAA
jgi:sugar phosphate permease